MGKEPHSKTYKELQNIMKFKVEFPLLISVAVEHICEKIPLTPEEFIVDTVAEILDILIEKISGDCYDFLDKYKDFSKE